MMNSYGELDTWIADWRGVETAPPVSPALVRFVRRRGRLLVVWVAAEMIVGVGGLLALGYLTWTRPDPIERWAMATLALMCLVVTIFSWWNWRGSFSALGETTADYLALASGRLVRIRRGIVAGWIVLAVEIAVFTPWVWYRLQGFTGAERPMWPWVFLATMCTLGVVTLVATDRWLRRDEAVINSLR